MSCTRRYSDVSHNVIARGVWFRSVYLWWVSVGRRGVASSGLGLSLSALFLFS
jgi:hypothetical protein